MPPEVQPEISCWHVRIREDGICLDCGARAAVRLKPEMDHVPIIERIANAVAAQKKIIADLLRNVGEPGVCRSAGCNAEICWMVHRNGKRTPYNLDGTNHFATCVDSERWKCGELKGAKGKKHA